MPARSYQTIEFLSSSSSSSSYRGADKSLARPDWKINWKFAIFSPTWN